MNILLADDHALIRQGIRQVITKTFPHANIEETGTGQETLQAIQDQDWSLVILDINLPDKNGLEVLKAVKVLRPMLPVLILSLYSETQYAVRMFKAGASAYLQKDVAPSELAEAMKKVLGGGKYVSPAVAELLVDGLTGVTTDDVHQTLSDRELEVLQLLGQGKTLAKIADHLALNAKTISTYRARLLEKLKVESTGELIKYAIDHHLVE